ncbi:MAG: serine hydrolase [Ignavibacteriales bacterium]|nr:serine hydrolase [Ignavibacteriales bacterium]
MRQRITNLIQAILCLITINSPTFAQRSLDSLLRTLPETCTSFMQQRGWPSLSVAIVLDQKIIYSQAFGYADVDKKIPATTNTIYRIASMTKLFNATMLMQLAERGKVNLNDPLIKYIPGYKPKYPKNTGPTTLRQLATHTSGLHVDAAQGFWHYFSNFEWVVTKGKEKVVWGVTKNDLLSTLDKVEIEYTPNKYPHYSNFGFQLLGIALENAAHEPFEKYIKSNILDPLDMRNSDFKLNEEQQTRFAVGYTYLEPDFQRYRAPDWDLSILKYSGGLYSTPEDIARFISFQFRDQTDGDRKILSGDGLRFMRTPQTLQSPESYDTYGIGWAIYDYEGHSIMAHAGGHWGFSAKAEVLRDLKLGVIIMTNCNYPQGNIGPDKDLTRIIIDKFIPILETKKSEPVFDLQKGDIQKYSGHYNVPGDYAHADVRVKNDTLYFSLREKPQFNTAILPVGLHRFCFAIDPGKNPMFRFGTDDSGKIVSLEFMEFRFKKK